MTQPSSPREHDQNPPADDEDIVLGAYFAAEQDILNEDNSEEDTTATGRNKTPLRKRNADPIEVPRPRITYATRVPAPSTIIAMISTRRVDRVPLAQASIPNICLPCGGGSSLSTPALDLHALPCGHRWCGPCLARALRFAVRNKTYGRLRCCGGEDDKEEIPMAVFRGVAREDMVAAYETGLEEHRAPARDKVYCSRHGCGAYIPRARRTKTQGTCPRCARSVCLRCRKGWATHQGVGGVRKCTAGKARLEVVANDRKLFSLARRRGWKRCPRCGVFVDKARGGCGSVICGYCDEHFFYG